ASGIKFEEDISLALPDDPKIRKAGEILRNSPVLDRLYVVVRSRNATSSAKNALPEASEFLAEYIQTQVPECISEIKLKLDEESFEKIFSLVYENLPYYFNPEDYAKTDSLLQPEVI